jgi:hypothetical protein
LGSADDLGDQQEEVGVTGRLAGGSQHRLNLPAVMGLVIEERRAAARKSSDR